MGRGHVTCFWCHHGLWIIGFNHLAGTSFDIHTLRCMFSVAYGQDSDIIIHWITNRKWNTWSIKSAICPIWQQPHSVNGIHFKYPRFIVHNIHNIISSDCSIYHLSWNTALDSSNGAMWKSVVHIKLPQRVWCPLKTIPLAGVVSIPCTVHSRVGLELINNM